MLQFDQSCCGLAWSVRRARSVMVHFMYEQEFAVVSAIVCWLLLSCQNRCWLVTCLCCFEGYHNLLHVFTTLELTRNKDALKKPELCGSHVLAHMRYVHLITTGNWSEGIWPTLPTTGLTTIFRALLVWLIHRLLQVMWKSLSKQVLGFKV
jgi:hypothetical protein